MRVVADRREGRWSYYSIVPEALAEVHDLAVAMQPKKGALRSASRGVVLRLTFFFSQSINIF